MKILIATSHYEFLGGSVLFHYTLLKYLKKYSPHELYLYSPISGDPILSETKYLGVRFTRDLKEFSRLHFDIIQISQNITAYEVRRYFPETPAILVHHGVNPFLEQPLIHDLNIGCYVAVAGWIRDHLVQKGIDPIKIKIIYNPIDSEQYFPISGPRPEPRRILMVPSVAVKPEVFQTVQTAAQKLGLKLGILEKNNRIWDIHKKIHPADIIIGCGRVMMEAMFCQRAGLILDSLGGDGMITPANYPLFKQTNFSGGTNRIKYSAEGLMEELRKYRVEEILACHHLALQNFSGEKIARQFLSLYQEVINHFTPKSFDSMVSGQIEFIAKTCSESRKLCQWCINGRQSFLWRLNHTLYKLLYVLFPRGTVRRNFAEKINSILTKKPENTK